MRSLFTRTALVAAAVLSLGAIPRQAAEAQKILVYCPVTTDDSGCNAIVNALAPIHLAGVDRGFDGSNGTIDLATADLGVYSAFIVPSLADDSTSQPYAMLRDAAIAHRLKDLLVGRIALWSGSPDQGSTNRAEKDALLRNLTAWAAGNYANVNGPGLVALLDQSENTAARYNWLLGLTGLQVVADTAATAYGSVRTLDAAGSAIVSSAGLTLAYANMASFGFYLPSGAAGVSLSAVGQTGTSHGGQVVLITSPGGNAGTAVIRTDRDDYAPGDTVTFTGTGFQPGESVTITLHEDPQIHADVTVTATADQQGAFVNRDFAPDVHDLGVRFVATATGSQGSVAQTTFTDAVSLAAVEASPGSRTVTAGDVASYTVTVDFNGSGNIGCTATLSVTGLPAGATATWVPGNVASATSNTDVTRTLDISTTSAAPTATLTIQATAPSGGGGQGCNGGTRTTTVTLTINAPANAPPVLDPIGNQSVNEGGLLSFTATATDATLTPLTFSLDAGAPAGASIDPGTGVFTWTPSLTQGPGSYPITVRVTDGGSLSDSEMITVTVNDVNSAPTFTKGADQIVNEGAGSQSVNWATGIAPSTDGDPTEATQVLTFTVSNDNNALFSTQPAIAPNGTLTYTAGPDAFGMATVTVFLKDDGGTGFGGIDQSATETFTITVNPVNDAPSFTKGADQTILEDAGAQTVPAWATGLSAGPANESGQTLTFSVTNNTNPGLFASAPVVDPATGTLTYTPAVDAFGTATLTLRLSDDGGTVNGGIDFTEQAFVITVKPVNDEPSFTSGGNQSVNEDAGAQSVAWATGILAGPANESAQNLTFTVTNDNNALFSSQPAVSATGQLSYTPAPDANGSATVTVFLSDDGGTSDGGDDTSPSVTFTITVASVNDAPSFTKGADQTVLEDAAAQTVAGWATGISAGPADESGQAVTFTVTNSNNALFSVQPSVAPNGTLTFTPAPNANGSATVTVVAQDNGGTANGGVDTSAPQTFTITITPVNDEPSFTAGANQTVNEDAGAQSVPGWATAISAGPSDEAGQNLTFVIGSNSNPGLFSVAPAVSATGTLTFTPAADANGTATIELAVQDDGGTANGGDDTSPTATFTITVNPVNDAPSFTKGADQTVLEDAAAQTVSNWATSISAGPTNESGQSVAFLVSAADPSLFSTQPAVASDGTLTFTPAPNAFGSTTITVTAQDNGGTANGGVDTSAPQTFTITITPVNDEPSFTAGANQTVNEDAGAQSVAWATNVLAGPPNESGQTLTFNVSSDNASLFSVQPAIDATGQLTYTPADDQFGMATVSVYLMDNGGTDNGGDDTSPTVTFTITVNPVNDAPTYTKGADQTVAEDAGAQTVTAWATNISTGPSNESAQVLTFAVSNNTNAALFAAGPAVDPATGTLTYTPADNANGTATLTLRLSDDGGTANGGVDFTEQTFVITVTPVNDAPVLADVPSAVSIPEEQPYTFDASATDIDLPPNTLTFSLVSGPAGAAIDPATGVFTWTPTEAQGGNPSTAYSFKVRVTDDGTTNGNPDPLSHELDITITVLEVNTAPVVNAIADQAIDEETAFTITATGTDADLPPNTLTWSLVGAPTGMTIDPGTGKIDWTPDESQGPGTYTVTVRLTDDGSPVMHGETTMKVTVNEINKAPVLGAIGNQTIDEGSLLTFTATATDPDVPANTLTFSLDAGAPAGASIDPSTGVFTWTPTDGPAQSTTVTIRVKDGGSPELDDSETITITVNNLAPTVTALTAPTTVAEGDVISFSVSGITDPSSVDQGSPFTYAFSCNAAVPASFSATNAGTCPAPDNGTVTINVRVRDKDGGESVTFSQNVTVTNVGPSITSVTVPLVPVAANTPVTVSWAFDDPGADTWQCRIEWDMGQGFGPLFASSGKTCTTTKVLPAGVYTVRVYVQDDDNGSDEEVASTYIVVYDPSAGFVTGGGWIDSPAGAYVGNPSVIGKATFGFVSQYKKGANVPTGNTEFQFHAAGMNFKSTAYEWLVVAGTKAQYKGTGTINGSGNYGFLVTALDGDGGNGAKKPDAFRIKIWDIANGGVVYDNKLGSGEDSSDATVLGGGSIVVHSK